VVIARATRVVDHPTEPGMVRVGGLPHPSQPGPNEVRAVGVGRQEVVEGGVSDRFDVGLRPAHGGVGVAASVRF
jgi:hypothetical protein